MIFRFSLNFKNVNISRDVMQFLVSGRRIRGAARAAAHWRGGAYTKNARVLGTNARSWHILKTQGFWGRMRVRRIYLKRTGFEDERLN